MGWQQEGSLPPLHEAIPPAAASLAAAPYFAFTTS
jgi:hypothetical protein